MLSLVSIKRSSYFFDTDINKISVEKVINEIDTLLNEYKYYVNLRIWKNFTSPMFTFFMNNRSKTKEDQVVVLNPDLQYYLRLVWIEQDRPVEG